MVIFALALAVISAWTGHAYTLAMPGKHPVAEWRKELSMITAMVHRLVHSAPTITTRHLPLITSTKPLS